VVCVLNARWRVVDEPQQWILQRRQGQLPDGDPRWRDQLYLTFCRSLRLFIAERALELRAAGEDIARHRVTSDCANLQSNGTDDPTTLGLDEQAVWHAMRETQILAGAQGN
jgi:hypothetical protein